MARYIDADELLRKSFRIEGHFDLPSGKAQNFSAINVTEILNFPTADVRPERHGRWILDSSDEYASHYHCNKCSEEINLCNEIYIEQTPYYCPNCGAKMDGDKNE